VVAARGGSGRRASVRGGGRGVRARVGPVVGGSVLAGAVAYLGLVLLVAPGVLLWGAWALTTPALIAEGLGPFRALGRSWRLAMPAFWRGWGVRALSGLVGPLLQGILLLPVLVASLGLASLLHADPRGAPWLAVAVLGKIVAGTVVSPFLAGVLGLLYVDRRMRAEALDIVWQRQLARRGGPR